MDPTLAALAEEDTSREVRSSAETPPPSRRLRAVSHRPAQMIDEAVRERARDAVRRSIEGSSDVEFGSV